MRKVDDPYVQHILGAISDLESFFTGRTYDDLLLDRMLQDAAVKEFEVIGEAAKRISPQTKRKYTEVPWKKIMGMRDKLIHDYFDIHLPTVWETFQTDIIPLRENMKRILQDIESSHR